MTKSPQAFRSIGEVARLVGVATHVLRYWETQFPELAPVKRADGRRYYRLDDVLFTAGIHEALREEGLTIRGARRLIAQDKGAGLRERGRNRLADKLGLEHRTPAATAARSTAPASRQDIAQRGAGGADDAAHVPARASRHPIRASVSNRDLPLFPDLATSASAERQETRTDDAPDGAGADWLSRLTATAAALRGLDTPLPADAVDVLAALRLAR